MTRGFVTGAPLGSYSTYSFVQPSPLSRSLFLSASVSPCSPPILLSSRGRARQLPRLHLGGGLLYYETGANR